MFRTDKHNNPTAFTTAIAKQGGLIEGIDYEQGDIFHVGVHDYFTAKLLHDPLDLTIKVIDNLTFYSKWGVRWIYIGIPDFIWKPLDKATKIKIVQFMYHHEGGTELEKLFV